MVFNECKTFTFDFDLSICPIKWRSIPKHMRVNVCIFACLHICLSFAKILQRYFDFVSFSVQMSWKMNSIQFAWHRLSNVTKIIIHANIKTRETDSRVHEHKHRSKERGRQRAKAIAITKMICGISLLCCRKRDAEIQAMHSAICLKLYVYVCCANSKNLWHSICSLAGLSFRHSTSCLKTTENTPKN